MNEEDTHRQNTNVQRRKNTGTRKRGMGERGHSHISQKKQTRPTTRAAIQSDKERKWKKRRNGTHVAQLAQAASQVHIQVLGDAKPLLGAVHHVGQGVAAQGELALPGRTGVRSHEWDIRKEEE